MTDRLPPERQLRISCGDRTVIVYPRRFSARLAADYRAAAGKGPKTAYAEFVEARYLELDQIAEMVLLAHLQAGQPMTLAEAQQHPIVTEWDIVGGSAALETVPEPPELAAAVAAAVMEDAPSPES